MSGIAQLFDNDSPLGRAVTKAGTYIAVNLLFIIGSLGIVTIGASLSAMYYTLMKYQRGGGEINPFRLFVKGFRENFFKATAVWVGVLCLISVLLLEMFWCGQAAGVMHLFLYGLGTVLLTAAVTAVYTFPGIAAFDAPVGRQLLNSLFFAGKSPVTVLLTAAAWLLPLYVTYSFREWMPLWAFLWCCFGFSATASVQSHFLLKLYTPYLAVSERRKTAGEKFPQRRSVRQTLKDMKRMGM
ncbi:MAG: YesL family protein [Lachnospiraceae bacterium]